jgi:hypothetical protein
MRRSVNELRALVLKAARGAGVPLGCGEDLAQGAVTLASSDPSHLTELTVALAAPFEAPGERVALAGPSAIDRVIAYGEVLRLESLDAPALLVAMVEDANSARDARILAARDGDVVTLTPSEEVPTPLTRRSGPLEVDPDLWRHLESLAAKTYVPASEASRVAGAGAGLTDND